MAIPVSKISSLSSGEFVGMVADDPIQKIELKAFCAEIINDHVALEKEQAAYKEIPEFAQVTNGDVLSNYFQIKKDIVGLVHLELERMMDTPELTELIIKKG